MEGLAGAVIGSYQLTRYLGSGGYGEVFLAQRANTGGQVVIKALRADTADSPIPALLRSAQTASNTGHVNILPVFDTGMDGPAAYIAMPYMPSGSIETLLQARPAIAEQRGVNAALVAPIVTQASAALQAAHAAGLVHGDLKPGNLFLFARPGQAPLTLVSDFGHSALPLAALAGAFPVSPNASRSPTELATELAAPEQFAGQLLPASDQFTLAAIACLLLTGRAPQLRAQGAAPRLGGSLLSEACAELLPPSVIPALRRALAAEPAQRFDDITAFASALDAGLEEVKGVSLAALHPRRFVAPPTLLSDRREQHPAAGSAAAPVALGQTEPAAAVSYAPTGIALADNILARVEQITHGKAGWLQRAFTYVFIGGIAAVINLVVLDLMYNVVKLPIVDSVRWLIAFLIAAEISTFSNFVLNDRFTFSHLSGHARSWWARCLRFHSTSAAGTIATLVMSFGFKTWLGMSALIAEAVAILLALILNFTMHHVWTYRHIKEDDSHGGAQPDEPLLAQGAQGRAS
ncbi:MAG TPA: GtrA family protein [Ktedonobacterales bacterium]